MLNDIKISGFVVLFIGVALLLFTFIAAYQFMMGIIGITSSQNLMDQFGETLPVVITYALRALFLGIMGWIGSILTRRGVQIITQEPRTEKKEPKESKEPPKA